VARIIALNNFDLQATREAVAAGGVPDHLLYGLNHFERMGHEVQVVPYHRSRTLQKTSHAMHRSPIPLGDLEQQLAVLRMARRADLIYSPCQNVGQLLGYLRAVGVLKTPIVWVVHHPLDLGRLKRPRRPVMRALLRGLDAYPALSAPVADDLAAIAGSSERTAALRWGPDPDWYPANGNIGRGVVAAGRTNRDFETFGKAASQTEVPTWIVCPVHVQPRLTSGSRTTVIASNMAYTDLVGLYAQARAVAIPLHVRWPWPINGLQSLMDALGMGKPVILTRNPWIDIDVEKLGIGMWVAPGDVAGWRDAITYLDQQPDVAAEMGRRARALVESGEHSSVGFANQVMDVFKRVLER
jgi:glycosyltransferase involved in cell wall biosynthesis